MKILLAVPTNRGVRGKTTKSLLELIANTKEHDFEIVIAEEGYDTSENRNYIASQALKKNCDYILTIDDDMTFPANTLQKLLDTGKRIVGVLSYSRMLPLKPTVVPVDKITDELFECKEVGGGVLLIDTKVFKEVKQPWFATEKHDFGMVKVGEDAYFCHRAREQGIKVYCEPSLSVGHLGEYNFGK